MTLLKLKQTVSLNPYVAKSKIRGIVSQSYEDSEVIGHNMHPCVCVSTYLTNQNTFRHAVNSKLC